MCLFIFTMIWIITACSQEKYINFVKLSEQDNFSIPQDAILIQSSENEWEYEIKEKHELVYKQHIGSATLS